MAFYECKKIINPTARYDTTDSGTGYVVQNNVEPGKYIALYGGALTGSGHDGCAKLSKNGDDIASLHIHDYLYQMGEVGIGRAEVYTEDESDYISCIVYDQAGNTTWAKAFLILIKVE